MRRQNLPDQSDQMSIDEMEIALSYLKKRFTDYSLDQIMLSLVQHVQNYQSDMHQNQRGVDIQQMNQNQEEPFSFQNRRTRITHYNREQRDLRENIQSISAQSQAKLNQQQEIKLVALFFCQTGLNVRLVQHFFPDMTPQKYRSYIDKITGQAINDLQKFLRYEHNIQIQYLNTEQKRSLRQKLMKVRDWLGPKDPSQLQTFLAFIDRHYRERPVEIGYDSALKLYKTFLEIIKSPFVNVMEIGDQDRDLQIRPPQPRTSDSHYHTAPIETISQEQRKNVVQLYIKEQSIQRVSSKLNQQWGYSLKWTQSSVRAVLKHCLKKAIQKVIISRKKYIPRNQQIYFRHFQQEFSQIFQSSRAQPIKVKLFKFFVANKITVTGLINLIKEINAFFHRGDEDREIVLSDSEDVSVVPKVQFDVKNQREKQANTQPTQAENVATEVQNTINVIVQPQLNQTDIKVQVGQNMPEMSQQVSLPNVVAADDKFSEITQEQIQQQMIKEQSA